MYAACLALFTASPAHALDLDEFAVAFTYTLGGQAGNDGVDSARDVAIDSVGNAVVVGYLDGAPGHEKDGKVLALAPDGSVIWEFDPIDAGLADAEQGSDDRVEAVTIDPGTGAYVWCGSQGGAGVGTEARNWYWIAGYDENAAGPDTRPDQVRYDYTVRAGGSDSLENACFGLAQTDVVDVGGLVYTAGFGLGNDDANGVWYLREYSDLGVARGQIIYDAGSEASYPDQAFDVAAGRGGGFLVVGTQQATLDVPTWLVQYYAFDSDTPLWTHQIPAENGRAARAEAVVYDPTSRKFYVAGTIDDGTAQSPDSEWFVVAYEEDGNGQGGADIDWTRSVGEGNLVDDVVGGIALDANRDVVVGGTVRDPSNGRASWRVIVVNDLNGVTRSEWNSGDFGADSFLENIDVRDERVALAGSIDDGSGDGPQFASIVLEIDTDEDGVPDTIDACPDDPNKADAPGVCGCGIPDVDSDEDGVLNCLDDCPGDPNKVEPGLCGCGQPDVDSDGDGVLNCDDFCPADPDKVEVGECGCGTPDDDLDGDGVLRCRDACPDTEPGVAVTEFGCDSGEQGDDPDSGRASSGGCGCQTGSPSSAGLLLGLALLGWRGRRRNRISGGGGR